MHYAALIAATDAQAAEQASLDRLDAHVADITSRTPQTRAEAAELVDTLAGELERLFPEVAVGGPIHVGLQSLALYLLADG
ncbi:MAG: hypothetical protein O9296_01890 [Novosphingobium sp.]|nr:hypothetical protein [Novosphingobium sp.]